MSIRKNLITGSDIVTGHQDRLLPDEPRTSFTWEVDPASQAPLTAFDAPVVAGRPQLEAGSSSGSADDSVMSTYRSGKSIGTSAAGSVETHECATFHSSERALARCHFEGALVSGLGPYAVVIGCGPRTRVRLFKSHVSAGRALALLESRGCGRACVGDHRLADVSVGRHPSVTWEAVNGS